MYFLFFSACFFSPISFSAHERYLDVVVGLLGRQHTCDPRAKPATPRCPPFAVLFFSFSGTDLFVHSALPLSVSPSSRGAGSAFRDNGVRECNAKKKNRQRLFIAYWKDAHKNNKITFLFFSSVSLPCTCRSLLPLSYAHHWHVLQVETTKFWYVAGGGERRQCTYLTVYLFALLYLLSTLLTGLLPFFFFAVRLNVIFLIFPVLLQKKKQ